MLLCKYLLICMIATSVFIRAQQIDITNNFDAESIPISNADTNMIEDKLQGQETQKVEIKLYYDCLYPDCRNFDIIQMEPTVEKLSQYLDLHHYPYGKAELQAQEDQKVDIKVYYECFCPYSRDFVTLKLAPTVEKLSQYLDIHVYPYGKAKTIFHDGVYEFKCQHGPGECYGNKLHACSIEQLGNMTEAVMYITCMMDQSQANKGSDNVAADKCGSKLKIDSEPIKECAISSRGDELLKYYGDESKKANFSYVPYILINGAFNDGDHFKRDVCAIFKVPPPSCSNSISVY